MELALFYIIGAVVVASALCVVFLERPIHNVLFMIVTMIGLAGLFILLRAEFIAMVQLIVYAGAVMVLFLFVIMLLNLEQIRIPEDPSVYRRWIGVGFAVLLLLVVLPFVWVLKVGKVGTLMLDKAPEISNTEILGRELFTTYLLPFEIASVLLLAAIIGAVVLAKRRSDEKMTHS
jgi:NADH-quinone oxidoreductase subunit J|uniref:NADH-quinone oxidoreductase subunit J n=1 Tax=Desulfomonile tiedjei TaxID=2358 RepID=A0A7C4APZ7_9BACT